MVIKNNAEIFEYEMCREKSFILWQLTKMFESRCWVIFTYIVLCFPGFL